MGTKEKTKHTPGLIERYVIDSAKARFMREDDEPTNEQLVTITRGLDYAALRTADAAPDLLAALTLCERALEERDTEADEYAAKQARAAIAKAKGE